MPRVFTPPEDLRERVQSEIGRIGGNPFSIADLYNKLRVNPGLILDVLCSLLQSGSVKVHSVKFGVVYFCTEKKPFCVGTFVSFSGEALDER